MDLLDQSIEISDVRDLKIHSSPVIDEWKNPTGTDYIYGKALHIETGSGLSLKSNGYSAIATTERYKFLEYSQLLSVEIPSYKGLSQWTELDVTQPGRLNYIDGCSNTNVIAPLKNGDPCINYLFIPPRTRQTAHVHPSARVVMVVQGTGIAHFWTHTGAPRSELRLKEGMKVFLPRFERHCFNTDDDSLSVLVLHPDSDGGPLDEVNPMFTRTYCEAISQV